MANIILNDGIGRRVELSATGTGIDSDPYVLGTGSVAAAGENHIGEVGGKLIFQSVTFTRPADTTAYAAKDAVSNSTGSPTVLTFTSLMRVSGGLGYNVKARLMTNQSTCVARFRLHLFRSSPTAINDNSPYTFLWADRSNWLGYIDFSACQTEGSGSDAAFSLNDTVRLVVGSAGGSLTVYGLLVTLDAFTPANGQQFHIGLNADVN